MGIEEKIGALGKERLIDWQTRTAWEEYPGEYVLFRGEEVILHTLHQDVALRTKYSDLGNKNYCLFLIMPEK